MNQPPNLLTLELVFFLFPHSCLWWVKLHKECSVKELYNTSEVFKQREKQIWNLKFHADTAWLSLIDKHFLLHHNLHKLFNWNNVKISYSYLPNIKSIINAHSRNILHLSPTIGRTTCNCINISQCPKQQVSQQ